MTRINVVAVESLTRQHLIAEYRELPRTFQLAYKAFSSGKPWSNKQPKEYTLGTGHVLFFYDKLLFLSNRHESIVVEMLKRGYNPIYQGSLFEEWKDKIPSGYWKNYIPTENALMINKERIDLRNSSIK